MGKKGSRISQAEFIMVDPISNEDPRWENVTKEYLRGCSSHTMGTFASPDLREQIGVATFRYAELKSIELETEPLSAAIKKVDRICKRFEILQKEFHSKGGSDVADYCKNLIDAEYKRIIKIPDSKVPWEQIDILTTAIKRVQWKLRQNKGVQDDTAFPLWIVRLISILEPAECPVTINKGTLEGGTTEPSPFVRLVWALQKQFVPAHLHQHMHSFSALAKAMDSARRDPRVASRD